jgi:hypothetical protein
MCGMKSFSAICIISNAIIEYQDSDLLKILINMLGKLACSKRSRPKPIHLFNIATDSWFTQLHILAHV